MDLITEPGTIDDMVADAAAQGHRVTPRLIRDWTQQGLLDYPQKRPAGKGHGSEQAIYPANQRNLLITLLDKREGNNIRSLARIPVAIWMYWGEEFVPLRQARRALIRYLGDPEARGNLERDALRASKQRAKETALAILSEFDHPAATPAARRELLDALTDAAYTGQPDFDRLDAAIRAVFEPGYGHVRRAVGHPAAPLLADSVIVGMKARVAAVTALIAGRVTDQQLMDARDAHLFAYADYAAKQPFLAAAAPASRPTMYEPVTAQEALTGSCGHLLSAIGLEMLYPEAGLEMKRARAFLRRPPRSAFGLIELQDQRPPAESPA